MITARLTVNMYHELGHVAGFVDALPMLTVAVVDALDYYIYLVSHAHRPEI